MGVFDQLVGQNKIKKTLNHYLKLYSVDNTLPFLAFYGQKGIGKTEFARTFIKSLKTKRGDKKTAVELNCSSIKNVDAFFEEIFIPMIMDNEISILFDECHMLPKCLINAFLTIFNTEDKTQSKFSKSGTDYIFDFTKQTFLFATTELDQVFPPMKDRLTILDFEDYEQSEIENIIGLVCKEIDIDKETLINIADRTRGNARSAVKMAKEVKNFCKAERTNKFGAKEFIKFIDILGFNPLGVSNIEKKILTILKKQNCSLTELSSKTGLSRSAIQRESEIFLLKRDLIKIDTKRQITPKGKKVLETCS